VLLWLEWIELDVIAAWLPGAGEAEADFPAWTGTTGDSSSSDQNANR
jgi:hypothetical protein